MCDLNVGENVETLMNKTEDALYNMSVSSEEISNLEDEDCEEGPNAFGIVKQILKQCCPNMMHYFPRCKAAILCNASIASLTKSDVDALFLKEIGVRGIFYKSLINYKKNQRIEDENDNTDEEENNIGSKAKRGMPKDFKDFSMWKAVVSSPKSFILL